MSETVTIQTTKQYLEAIEGLRQNKPKIQTPYGYILEHGKEYGPRVFPKKVRKMADKQCYRNAYVISQREGYKYVEGVACHIIPTDHAWCVNDAGEVVDPTWEHRKYPATGYFGVEIPEATLHMVMLKTGFYGVFGNWAKWDEILDILKGKS